MKDKNRFSKLLKYLMDTAKIKNYTLAQEVQYDESYVSKWVTGSLMPSEKNSEKVLKDISACVVKSLNEEGFETLYSDYQVNQEKELEEAIFDNLKAEFEYVTSLKESTGSDVVQKNVFYPELTLAQFLKKMHHPVLRQVKALKVIMATDILAVDRHYQLSMAELEKRTNVNISQHRYPGVSFSMLINLDSVGTDNIYNAQFIQSMLTNLSSVDFQLYSCQQSQGKILFAVKEAYSVVGMIMDENHCLGVTVSEEEKSCNAIYDRLRSLCSLEALAVRRTTLPKMLKDNEFIQYAFARNQRWTITCMTESILPGDVFKELLEEYCDQNKEANQGVLMQTYQLSSRVLETLETRVLLSEKAIRDFAVSGVIDFFGTKIALSAEQRLRCFEYMLHTLGKNSGLQLSILRNNIPANLQHISAPILFLSDSFCYMRILCSGPENNLTILNCTKMCDIFRNYFDDMWDNPNYVDSREGIAEELINYGQQVIQIQMLMEK